MRRGTFCCTFSPGTRQVYGRRPLEGYSFRQKGGGCPSRLIVHPLDGTGDADLSDHPGRIACHDRIR